MTQGHDRPESFVSNSPSRLAEAKIRENRNRRSSFDEIIRATGNPVASSAEDRGIECIAGRLGVVAIARPIQMAADRFVHGAGMMTANIAM